MQEEIRNGCLRTNPNPKKLQTKILTVWRTLWMELDRMAAPVLPTAAGQVSDGFAFDTKYAGSLTKDDGNGNQVPIEHLWDTQHRVDANGHEPDDFDLAVQPSFPDTTLLIPAFQLACIDAVVLTEQKPLSWGLQYRPEVPFKRHLSDWSDTEFEAVANMRDINVRNDASFWNICGLGAFDPNKPRDGDPLSSNPNPAELWATGGGANTDTPFGRKGLFIIFNEAMRDQTSYMQKINLSPLPTAERLQGVMIHEVLHLFGFKDIVDSTGHAVEYDPNNSTHVENGRIMSGNCYLTTDPNDWKTFSDEQIRKIQTRANPQ